MMQQAKIPIDKQPFNLLATAHINWVYALARRQLGDANLADDATQAVFIAFWKKHTQLARNNRPVGGWLLRATHYACANISKGERRRKNRERKVAAMRSEGVQSVPAAEDSNTLQLLALDAAMHKLSTSDRDVLVARFFQNQSARQMAQAFNISEAAAEKRITRAVIKLRGIMARKKITMDSTALAALLSSGAGTAPNGLLAKVLEGTSGKAPVSLTAAHAARSIAFHTAHIPAIAGAAAVALALGVAAVVPIAIKARQSSAKPVPAEITPSKQATAANSTAAQSGVLTCVAYDMLVQKDFAWAIKTGGKLLSSKPGGVQAYDISARIVRSLAKAQLGGQRVIPGTRLNWLSSPLPFLVGNGRGAYQQPGSFNLQHTFVHKGTAGQVISQMRFQWHGRTYPNHMRIKLQFTRHSNIMYAYNVPIHGANLPYIYRGTISIKPGHALILLRRAIRFMGTQWYSAAVFDVRRYPYHLLHSIEGITGVSRYIRAGPLGLQNITSVASAWNRYAKAHPPKPVAGDVQWTKSLPDGISVTLQGISNGVWPLCPWTPTAVPLSASYEYLDLGQMAGLLKFEWPIDHPWRYPGIQKWQKNMTGFEWARIPGQTNTWSIGLDSGKWKIIGNAKPSATPQWNFAYKGYKFGAFEITPLQADLSTHRPGGIYMNLWTPGTPDLADQAIAVGAVTRQGKLVSPFADFFNSMARFQTSRSNAIDEYHNETIPISLVDVKRYVWITRPRHWVTFRGFAMQPSPLPSTVFASQQQQIHTITTRPTGTAKPIARIAANQTTPAGLMVLLGRALRSGNPLALQKLAYAPTSAERHLLVTESKRAASQNAYGLWGAATKQFGIAQMRAAGLGEVINNIYVPDFPKHWKIKGAHATPRLPLPHGVSWPAKGQPLHSLIKKNGLWYLDLSLTKAQIAQFNKGMRRSGATASPNAKAYHTVMRQLQSGKIKDAYALRDALEAALKKYSETGK